ncbi:aladin-like [Montipora foliosa]|uniref:aladin-like n=1 Tax=Montipora foliosa TaxID=591990 RepID=UPI0035F17791
MSSLSVFPPPPVEGEITLCEFNAKLIAESSETAKLSKYVPATQGLNYPCIGTNTESIRTSKSLSKLTDSEWCPFVQTEENTYKKLLNIWHSKGFSEMLLEIKKNKDEVPSWLWHLSGGTSAVLVWFSSFYGKIFPHLNLSREEMICAFSAVSSWENSPVRAFAWHPHVAKFVIAWQDDSVKVHTLSSDVVPLLKHKLQKAVSCVSWRPLSGSVLVVGCDNGLFVWTVDPTSPVVRLGSSSVRHLSYPGHAPVTTVSWSPSGHLLVSGSPADSNLMVWDISLELATPLYRAGGGVTLTAWSPDERNLFAATPSSLFRIWETQTWTCDKWSNLAGTCQAACWSPDGKVLLFSVANEPALYSLQFHDISDKKNSTSMAKGARLAVKCADLTPHTWEMKDESVNIGGFVQSMAWDPLGERLAVIFKGEIKEAQELVAVFKTRLAPTFEIMPCGFVRGPPNTVPELVTFQKNFKKGALLTVCWSDGSVSFIPFLFSPSSLVGSTSNFESGALNFTDGLLSQ